ncbi:MAG: tetratricopeptide repeat protein [Armatimonadetes bacterium]|nr:tetratricopeptide repeat protein [Armatimonadota bacterium]
MSRFGWLEMEDDAAPGRGHGGVPEREDLDESSCVAQADRYLREGYYESALQWYSRALRYNTEIEEAWAGQVRCLLELREDVEANVWADRGLERFPDCPDLLAAKALALKRTRGLARAMEYSDAALGVKGKTVGPYPWIARGDIILNGRGSPDSAKRCFSKALELGGHDWYTHYLVGIALMRGKSYDEARRRLSAAAEMDHATALVHCAVGECYQKLGHTGAAILAYNRALQVDRKCKRAKDRLASLERVGWLGRFLRRLRSA